MFNKMTWQKQLATQMSLALAGLFVLLPLLWLGRMAFDGSLHESRPQDASLWPKVWSMANFDQAWNRPITGFSFLNLLSNSLIVAASTTIIALLCGMTAGYAIARFRFAGRKFGLFATLVLITLPPAGLSAPFFIFFNDLKIRDSLLSLIIVYSVIAVPFAIWTVRNAVQTVPIELEEAATLEGGNGLVVFRWITLPLIAPTLAVAGFIAFTLAWSEFALAWVFISNPNNETLAMALFNMRGQNGIAWGTLSAMTILVALPVVILFYALGRYVITGLSLGTIKE
jgi:arabinogalactan oligomer/maltooligosaccharide transport system permease protein